MNRSSAALTLRSIAFSAALIYSVGAMAGGGLVKSNRVSHSIKSSIPTSTLSRNSSLGIRSNSIAPTQMRRNFKSNGSFKLSLGKNTISRLTKVLGKSATQQSSALKGIAGTGKTRGIAGTGSPNGIAGTGKSKGIAGTGEYRGIAGTGKTLGIAGTGQTNGIAGTGITLGIAGTGKTKGIAGTGVTLGIAGTGRTNGIAGTGVTKGIAGTGITTGIAGTGRPKNNDFVSANQRGIAGTGNPAVK